MAAVAGPEVARTDGNRPASSGGTIPFRRATTPRSTISVQTSGVNVTASTQNIQVTIEGTGYMTGILLEVTCTTAGNAATVAFQEDAPYSALDSVVLSDVSGESLNLTGFDLYLLNKYGGVFQHGTLFDSTTSIGTSDANLFVKTAGAGATGGSFKFMLRVPVAINNRNFLGLLGNQDRAMKYQLRDDLAASSSIYSTGPTAAGAVVINRYYESVTVPGRANANGVPQQIYPPKFGVQHFATRSVNGTAPAGSATINHYLQRLGNTIRTLILVFRSNGSRATAESNMPTRISFLLGDTTIFTESTAYRRWIMRSRYGYDADNGVLVYDFLSDLLRISGSEFGLDYLWTAGLVNAQFQITYPSGFGSTNNSLVVITDDLIVPDSIDIYAPDGV